MMDFLLRDYNAADRHDIAALIRKCAIEVNSRVYPQSVIDFMTGHYSPEQVDAYAQMNTCIVAVAEDTLVGTVSLGDEQWIYSTFVDPSIHRSKVGTALMARIEQIARDKGVKILRLQSSINAEPFYAHRGFVKTGESTEDTFGRSISMEKKLSD